MNENGENFKKELEELCVKYNTTIFAGSFGLKFNFQNKGDEDNSKEYYTQYHDSKEIIISE